jgi:amino-acid N-acetyltransferase
MRIEAARTSDLAGIRWLLRYEQLPDEDVSEQLLEHFLVYRDQKGVVGAVALEPFGEFVLLCSLVVATDCRHDGIGGRLTLAAEALAQRRRASSIYLLTTSAERFFAKRGYRTIPRTEAPIEIHRSSQFSRLCPSTAILMVKP